MSKLNIYIKSHLKIFQCICRMERFLDLYKNLKPNHTTSSIYKLLFFISFAVLL